MKLPLFRLLHGLRASYWFVPSMMTLLAIVAAPLMVWLDIGPAQSLLQDLSWYQKSKPEGAREVLSSIAGSMITVAGVVFSITIVAISFAASQYGPRILTNFMSDRGNQVTLGTFIATFVYSIVVLRTIQSGGDGSFVPQLAVLVAMLLALCSIAVLIYFIHHVPESIDINSVTARIGRNLLAGIDRNFPAHVGDPADEASKAKQAELVVAAGSLRGDVPAVQICSDEEGYVQALDHGHLLAAAREHGLVVRVLLTPGHFAFRGRTLATAVPPHRVTAEVIEQLRKGWSLGTNRTPEQDVLFLVDELVEISARALSPGVNDPYTAMTCMDWLTAAAAEVARRRPPSAGRLDRDGELRVVIPPPTFDLHMERGFGRTRPYAATDINAATHFLSRMALLGAECGPGSQLETLKREAQALFDLALTNLKGPSADRLREEMAATRKALRHA